MLYVIVNDLLYIFKTEIRLGSGIRLNMIGIRVRVRVRIRIRIRIRIGIRILKLLGLGFCFSPPEMRLDDLLYILKQKYD